MTTPTSNLGLLKGVGSDNWRTYLKTNLAASLDVLDKAVGQVANVKGYGAVGDGTTDDRTAVLAAETAVGTGGSVYFPPGTYKLASTTSLLATTHLVFAGGAQLAPATATTLTVNGPITAPESRIFGGLGTVVLPNQGVLWARWFGAVGDGTGDDGPAINRAIVAAQQYHNGTVVLGAGVFRVTTQVVVAGSGTGIAIVGLIVHATSQQGSLPPPCAINWAGGASAAISVTEAFVQFANFAIYNTGTGTAAMDFNPNGHTEVQHVSFAGPGGASAWSTAAINSSGGLNYSSIRFCNFDVSPSIKMSGVHTTLEIANCVFDAIGAPPHIDANGVTGDMISIHNCTFNAYQASPTFFDCSASTGAIGNVSIHECEIDADVGHSFQTSIAKLKNVYNFSFYNNEVSDLGSAGNTVPLIQLTNVARSYVWGNNLSGVNKALIKCNDATSYVHLGPNRFNLNNTVGMIDTSGAAPGTVVVPSVNEIQQVAITGSPTGGTFTLTFGANTTAGIAYNATAATVQAALELLASIGSGNAAVTGGPLPDTAVKVEFRGTLGQTDVAQMTASGAGLTGGSSPAVTVSTFKTIAVARLHGESLNPGGPALFVITATTNAAFELQIPVMTDGDPGLITPGQVFWVLIKNTSGGAMGAVTFRSEFKSSGAFTTPATGKSRSLTYYYDGTNAIELSRSSADVPN